MSLIVASLLVPAMAVPPDRPEFVVTCYEQVEVKGHNGLPDFNAPENHWTKRIERYYVAQDTRKLARASDGSVTPDEVKLSFPSAPTVTEQFGPCSEALSKKFKWVCNGPDVRQEFTFGPATFLAQKIEKCSDMLMFLVVTETQDTEIRQLNGVSCRRVRTREGQTVSGTVFGRGSEFNPMRPAGLMAYKPEGGVAPVRVLSQ